MDKSNNAQKTYIEVNNIQYRKFNDKNNIGCNGFVSGHELLSESPLIETKIDSFDVDEICNFAFEYGNFSYIVIPDSIKTIDFKAFRGCHNLKEINLPDSISIIGHSLFNGCTNLEFVSLSNNIQIIPEYTFHKCIRLKKIILPDNIKNIHKTAFSECYYLSEIVYRDETINVKYIDGNLMVVCDEKYTMSFIEYFNDFIFETKNNTEINDNEIKINENIENKIKNNEIMETKETNENDKVEDIIITPIDLICSEIKRIINVNFSKENIEFFISYLYDEKCYILTLIVDDKWYDVNNRQSAKIHLNTDLEKLVTLLYNRTT